jgi:hypothetical protein
VPATDVAAGSSSGSSPEIARHPSGLDMPTKFEQAPPDQVGHSVVHMSPIPSATRRQQAAERQQEAERQQAGGSDASAATRADLAPERSLPTVSAASLCCGDMLRSPPAVDLFATLPDSLAVAGYEIYIASCTAAEHE